MAPADWEREDEADDGPLEADLERFGDDDEPDAPDAVCGHCGAPVPGFVSQCPQCGMWITPQAPRSTKGIAIAAVLVVILLLLGLGLLR